MQPATTPLPTGVWGVLATPFTEDLRLDTASLTSEAEFFLTRGVTGLVALGVFGEAASLTAGEQDQVVRTIRDVGEKVPLVAGVAELATPDVRARAQALVEAADGELTGLMVKANHAEPAPLIEHFGAVGQATGAGLVLQDYPADSGVAVTSSTLVEVVQAVSDVVAVKAEAPPTSAGIAELSAALDIPLFGGLGGVGLLDELAAGAAGAMTGFSHPEGLWAAIDAYRDGGFAAAHAAYAPWLPLANFEGQPRIGLALRKEVLRRRGAIQHAAVRPPAAPAPASLLPQLERHLQHTPLAIQR